MAEISLSQRRVGENASGTAGRAVVPAEGWLTLLLHALVMVVTANSIVKIEQSARYQVLIPLAIGGLMIGYFAARTPALDAVSHVLGAVIAVAASLGLSAIYLDGPTQTWSSHGGNAFDLFQDITSNRLMPNSDPLSDHQLLVLVGLTLWLVGYSSAWLLYRCHMLVAALIAPAALIFISMKLSPDASVRPIAAFSIAALVMAARNHAFVQQLEWARLRIPAPRSFPNRVTMWGSALAVIVLVGALTIPIQGPSRWINQLSDRGQSAWEWGSHQLGRIGQSGSSGSNAVDDYSQFSDSFEIGKPFDASTQVVATLSADHPIYLAARRYDVYTGTGWESGVDSTFRMPGDKDDVSATSVTFLPQQFVALSPEVSTDRQREAGVVTLHQETGGLLFSIDTYMAANVPTIAVVGWIQIAEQTVDIQSVDVSTLPADLQDLVRALKQADIVPDSTGQPKIVDADQANYIAQLQTQLQQYPVNTALSFSPNGDPLLTFSGRIPNYDDIEAVMSNTAGGNATHYSVVGGVSDATEEELRSAGEDYPAWIVSRYTNNSPTVTPETIALAKQIIANSGASSEFDKAWAVQEYLRDNYQYATNSEETPKGQDAVDFFLFGKKIGRCEEYASSMIVLLRSQGVPARLVSGYRAGAEVDGYGDYIYRGDQAHTWVEVYFPKYGWIPFEPTSDFTLFDYGGNNESSTDASTPEAQPDIAPTPTPEAAAPTAEATPSTLPPVANTSDDDDSGWLDSLRGGLSLIMLLATLAVAIAIGVMAAAWAWGLRGLKPGASLYARVLRIGKLWGIEPHPSMTPSEYANELSRVVPKSGRAVQHVANLYTLERYGGVDVGEDAQREGTRAWHAVRHAILDWRPWRRANGRGRSG